MKHICIAFTAAAFLLGNTAFAQETNDSSIEIFEIQTDEQEGALELAAPMIIEHMEDSANGETQMRVIASSGTPGSAMFMSDSAGMGMLPMFGGGGGNSTNLLHNPSVQKDLELVDDQMDRIREIQKEFGRKVKDSMKDLNSGNGMEFAQMMMDLQAQQKSDIEGVLLDHQRTRLQQVALQMQMKQSGTAGTLASSKIAEELGITDEQKKRIKEKAAELQKEMEEKIAQLKEKSKRELLNELTPEQQKKLTAMTGDEFKNKASDFQRRFQMRGNRNRDR